MKYQRFTPSSCKDIEIRKSEFVAKTQKPSMESCELTRKLGPNQPVQPFWRNTTKRQINVKRLIYDLALRISRIIISLYVFCLSVCLFVCTCVSLITVKTAEPIGSQFCVGFSRPKGRGMNNKKVVSKSVFIEEIELL